MTSRERKIKWLLANDREFFYSYILRHYIKNDNIGELHKEWFELLSTVEKLGIVAPRGHAKSTIINLADNLFDICNHGLTVKQPYILIISDTPAQAIEHLGSIVEELEGNPKIHKYYGHLYSGRNVGSKKKEKWTESTIVTSNEVKVEAKGWRSRMRGLRWKESRPTKIVIDDIENDDDVYSVAMRERLKRTFTKNILNLGEPETKYRFVGTILHFDSLLQNEYKNPREGWTWKFYKAINEESRPLWHEWWTQQRLETKRNEIGNIAFEQEFMNNPLDDGQQIIKPKAFYDVIDTGSLDYFGYIDLAISEKETADYTAIVTVGRDRYSGKIYTLRPVKIRGNIDQQLELVFEMYKEYPWMVFGVETVAYQMAFFQLLTTESARRGIYIPTRAIDLDKDKVRRAISITPYIDNGTILFNNNYQDFMAELIQFPKASHDDYVDGFTGAVKLALEGAASSEVISGHGIIYPK